METAKFVLVGGAVVVTEGNFGGCKLTAPGVLQKSLLRHALKRCNLDLSRFWIAYSNDLTVSGVVRRVGGMLVVFLNPKAKLGVLVHELKHVEQYQRGDFEFCRNHVIWKGVEYPKPVNRFRTEAEVRSYFESPWEIEAYRAEYETLYVAKLFGFRRWYRFVIAKRIAQFKKHGQ